MSRTKSKQPEPLRYSGPELSELLDEVATRHGADASIASVNRIRTGGIAGFFCKEEFEILVDQPAASQLGQSGMSSPSIEVDGSGSSARPAGSASAPTIAAARASAVVDGLSLTSNTAQQESVAEVRAPQPPTVPDPPRLPEPPQQPLPSITRTATIAVPFDPVIEPDPVITPDPIPLGGPRAPEPRSESDLTEAFGSTADDTEARALRAQAIQTASGTVGTASSPDEVASGPVGTASSRVDTAPNQPGSVRVGSVSKERRPGPGEPVPVIPGRATLLAPAPASSAAGVRRMADATPIAPAIEAAMLLTEDQARTSPFWLELYRTQRELASFMPLASPFVAVVGTLPQAMTVTRRLRQGPTMGEAEVYVLTDRAGIVSEPMWNLVRSGRRLLEIAAQRAELPTVFIIDVPDEHPNWLFPLQNRLRLAGVSLFHYVVNGRPTARDLEHFRQGIDLPYAIDLVARLEPEKVLEFIELRHPVASVSGTILTAEFLVAMRRQVTGLGVPG